MSFTERIRRKIKKRDIKPDGYDFGHNECSHHDHQRDTGYYNSAENGHLVNRPEHWTEHRLAELGEIYNGLNKNQIKRAREQIWNRMSDDEKAYLKY